MAGVSVVGSAGASPRITLGSPSGPPGYVCRLHPRMCGWGTVAPRTLTNGGDPTATITRIRWSGWEHATAVGQGISWVFGPHGGVDQKPVIADLRASNIGDCGGSRAYRSLLTRKRV